MTVENSSSTDSRPLLRDNTIRGEVLKITIVVPADSVQRVWLRTIDPVRTTLAVIGAVVGIAGVISAVAIATEQSCPFIYSWDGSRYVFDADLYGGAITRGLERDDYGELASPANDHGLYRLLVTNEVNKTEYTNRLELLVGDHDAGIAMKADEFGHFYGFRTLRAPTDADDVEGHDLLPWLKATDHAVWEPIVPPTRDNGARQEITLTFEKPMAATSAFLVARVSTGLWGSQMIRPFSQLRGTALRDWYTTIDTNVAAAAALYQWNLQEELYALKVSVDEPQGWSALEVAPAQLRRAIGWALKEASRQGYRCRTTLLPDGCLHRPGRSGRHAAGAMQGNGVRALRLRLSRSRRHTLLGRRCIRRRTPSVNNHSPSERRVPSWNEFRP